MNEVTVAAHFAARRLVRTTSLGLAFIALVALTTMATARDSTAAAQHTQAVSAKVQPATVAQLLAAARNAYTNGRLVAPAHDNAIEYYEAVLQREPGNPIARGALRESFPYAAAHVERTIARGNFRDAAREIDLLAKAEPTNYTLNILRAKLDARQSLVRRNQQQTTQQGSDSAGTQVISGSPADENGQGVATLQRTLTLRALAASWIEITDAQGHLIDSRILQPGESQSYRSAGPLRVTLGNAEGVDVTRDGKPLIVKPGRHSRVAHFEVFAAH